MQWFSFNDKTSDEFDLIINKYPGIISPNRRMEKIEVIGRHGLMIMAVMNHLHWISS